ncbi:peptidoglycan DD-metalloendopeptidase family protein [Candidatus Uhrbacteria bacterium]|nr:peptidoglycan DD-metalloendopeptidase family protein [Candidatus Uhrbacteria bacterium]
MRLRQSKLLASSALLLLTLVQGSGHVFAATVGVEESQRATTTPVAPATEGSTGVREVFRLNDEIQAKQQRLNDLQKRIEQYRQSIVRAQGQAGTLQRRLAVLEDRIAKRRLDIEKVTTEREQVELEIQATRLKLGQARDRITRQRRLLIALLVELRSSEAQPALQIVLANASVGSYFAHRNRVAQTQERLHGLLVQVRGDREELEASEHVLTERESELRTLSEKLAVEQNELREEQDGKARLLGETQSSERRYQQLVAELKGEQEQIDQDIVALEASVRKQLEAIDADFGKLGRVAFSWPVTNRGISAYFHDPEYPFRHIFEHPAIDIRAGQGIPIGAAAPGYVARAKDAGLGYSYIMIIHPGGFSTVYGHVSRIDVQEGTYVTRGQVIGAVGGRPGTRGAGRLTTGAHLHFEVRLNGIPVNPLNYLL